jgi:hypothetical protein
VSVRAREDDHGNQVQTVVMADIVDDIEPTSIRQLKIHQDESRQSGMMLYLMVQVTERCRDALLDMDIGIKSMFRQRLVQQFTLGRAILDDQHCL